MLKATEIMFLFGLLAVFAGFWLKFGLDIALIVVGAIVLIAAFRNATEREKDVK